MSFDETRLSDDLAEAAKGGPAFQTVVVKTDSGAEQRVALWSRQLGQWKLDCSTLDAAHLDELLAFFYSHRGRLTGFRFKDWDDFEAVLNPQTPTGYPTMQLYKHYDSGVLTFDRKIVKVVTGSLTMTLATAPYAYTSVDVNTGIVTLPAISSKAITGISKAALAVVTCVGHGFTAGTVVYFSGVGGMTQINGLLGTVQAAPPADSFTVNINSTAFTTYTSGGTAAKYLQPTDVVTASYEFDVPVRFDTDRVEASAQDNVRAWNSIPLVELLL